jgi:hypothetical protein
MIGNYLGFPRGISGRQLVCRAWEQAVLLLGGAAFEHLAMCEAVDVWLSRAVGRGSPRWHESLQYMASGRSCWARTPS